MSENSTSTPPNQSLTGKIFRELIQFVFISVIIVIPVRIFIAQPFIVSGASMSPTLENGEYLIVDEISYRFKEPERGDVVVFKYPLDENKFFIKRIIALPNETIEISSGKVKIKLKTGEEMTLEEAYANGAVETAVSRNLSDSEYFVMGDNRKESLDSRAWGPLNRTLIVGRPLIRLLPLSLLGLFPGSVDFDF